MSAPEYEIRTVEDFLKIPPDKIAHCLKDFRIWLEVMRGALELKAALNIDGFKPHTDVFGWLDDGKHEVFARAIVTRSDEA